MLEMMKMKPNLFQSNPVKNTRQWWWQVTPAE